MLLKSVASRQFVKFVVVSGAAAVANIGSRILFGHWFSYVISILLAFLVGLGSAFLLNRVFVFRETINSLHSQALWFTLVNLFAVVQTLAISIGLADYILPALHVISHVETIAHGVGVMVPAITSYLGHKHFSFRTPD